MKVTANRIDDFIKTIQPGVFAALLYGPDQGLVEERAEIITRKIVPNADQFLLVEMPPEKIKENPAQLNDEISSISFFGGRKLIKIRDAGDSLTKTLKEIFTGNTALSEGAAFILVLADELTPRSSLRLLFESNEGGAALPCYKDDEAAISILVRKKLREIGFTFEEDVPEMIAAGSLGNRMVLTRELEKLELYMGEKKRISVGDVAASVADSAELSLEGLVNAVADRDVITLSSHLKKALSEGVMPVTIFRYVANYFLRLNVVAAKVKGGASDQEAISSLKPPVFFKQVPLMKRHAGFWGQGRITKVLRLIYEGELKCKSESTLAPTLCGRFLTQIARIR